MLTRVRAAVVTLGIAALGAVACGDRVEEEAGPLVSEEEEVPALDPALASHLPPGADLAVAEEGRRLFVVCGVCHGLDAGGTELGPPLNDAEWIRISGELEEIEAVTRSGVADPEEYPIPMPVMGGGDFTPEQLRAVATYVHVISRGDP